MDWRSPATLLLALGGFAVIHSLTAGAAPRRILSRIMDERLVEGWYRLAYNLLSGLTLLPIPILLITLPDRVLYSVRAPWSLLMLGVQFAGVVGMIVTLFSIDLPRFAGLSQAAAYISGQPLPLPEERLQQGGVYAWTRHPLYLFSLMIIWPLPFMSVNTLLFNLGATAYLTVGSFIEERRLERMFGAQYRDYSQRVSWLIPFPPRRP